MGKSHEVVKRIKGFLSQHPVLCHWFSRVKAVLNGLYAIRWRLFKRNSYYIDSTVKVTGWSHVSIGMNSVVGAGSWLNVNIREGEEPTLIIGKDCFIGRNNFITVGERVVFGDYCLTASNCAFIGSSHDIADPNAPYISTGVDSHLTINIGTNCFFGYGATVIGNVKVGYGSVIGAGAVVLKDVPPLSVVIGNPGRVVKRFSCAQKCWVPVAEYIEETLLSEGEYEANMRERVGFYPLPISAARSTLGDI